MIQFKDIEWFDTIRRTAEESPEEEVCGVIIHDDTTGRLKAINMPNVAEDRANHFKLSPDHYLSLFFHKEVLAIYHSHTAGHPFDFSEQDKASSEECEMPFLLYAQGDLKAYIPQVLRKALHNRRFLPLVYDCLSLCEHYVEKHWQTPVKPFIRTLLTVDSIPRDLLKMVSSGELVRTDVPEDGSVAVIALRDGLPSHAGVVVGDMLLHQLSDTFSKEEPLSTWKRRILYYISERKK